ncbi:hypothetical protein M408DRAFT_291652 [Serendipita vermifera MAFF 305830]|uniref:Uncharacterized protein n=1 Tax=Serendipita vermifera MAFF 305830 TaxID=933852 RepID=A0A0C3ASN0_SERVB|nr:hypothetical protein M408DRAFT_291652 [Serendipita vermifera MAFF 305830]
MTRFLPVPRNILFQDASPTRANQHKMQYHKANDIPLRALYCSLLCRSQMLMKAFLRAVFFGAKDNNVSYTKTGTGPCSHNHAPVERGQKGGCIVHKYASVESLYECQKRDREALVLASSLSCLHQLSRLPMKVVCR